MKQSVQENYLSYISWIEGENNVFKDHCASLIDKFEKNPLTSNDPSIKSQLKDIFVTSCQMSFEICSIMKKYAQKNQIQDKGYFTTPKPFKKNSNVPNFETQYANVLQFAHQNEEQSMNDIFNSLKRSNSHKSFQSILLQDNKRDYQLCKSNNEKNQFFQDDVFVEKKSIYDSALNSFDNKQKKIKKTRKKMQNLQKRGNYTICSLQQKKEAIRLAQIKSVKEASEILGIPQKNIKRWIYYGPERKKGAGRKTCDPQMEKKLLEWVKNYYKENHKQPCNNKLKQKAIDFTIRPSFQASKGWCDKFLKRNAVFFERLEKNFGVKNQLILSSALKKLIIQIFMNKNKLKQEDINFKVMVRIRPPLANNINEQECTDNIEISQNEKVIQIQEQQDYTNECQKNYALKHSFSFDQIFGFQSTQQQVFDSTGLKAVENVFQGYNSTILAYGQTGTGKTFTIEGSNNPKIKSKQEGLIPRSVQHIFNIIEQQKIESEKIIVRVSYLQIYNESITDLLRPERKNLQIRQNKEKGVFVENLSEFIIRNSNDALKLLKKGQQFRTTASTKINEVSSRSHAVFMITVERLQSYIQDGKEIKQGITGVMNLVDLAGSERLKVTQAKGKRLEESKNINQSLSCLGKVIAFLTDKNIKKMHIPYRESKLTRLLERSFGGNCITIFMAMISPGIRNFCETLQTLKFAKNAKKIKNKPKINQNLDQKSLLVRYEAEIKQLKDELAQKKKELIDKAKVLELEEKHQKAQKDKQDALKQLELRTQAFIKEREEKKMLKQKIEYLQKYVMSNNLEIPPDKQLTFDYQQQRQQFEQEKHQMEINTCKSQQYQNLLLQQRDIMQALTSRLKERDEAIAELQQELEVCDKIQNETEELLEIKNARVIQLENLLRKNMIQIPAQQDLSNENQDEEDQEFQNIENSIQQNSFDKQNNEQNIDYYQVEIQRLQQEFQNTIQIMNAKNLQQQRIQDEKLQKSEQINKELVLLLQQNQQYKFDNSTFHQNIKIMKQKIYNVIKELSNDTTQDNLQLVAEELLSLNNFIINMDKTFSNSHTENTTDNSITKQNSENKKNKLKKKQEQVMQTRQKKILHNIEDGRKNVKSVKKNRKKSKNLNNFKINQKKGYQTSEFVKFFPAQLNWKLSLQIKTLKNQYERKKKLQNDDSFLLDNERIAFQP